MGNPLVAQPVSSTTAVSGVWVLEDAQGLKSSIESGDWASAVLGAAGTAMDALAFVEDPFGSILSACRRSVFASRRWSARRSCARCARSGA